MINYSIFIVDDEQTIREGISMALETNYVLEAFSNAEDAIKAMKKKSPDLVLLDIGLPGMSGIEALREIKNLFPDVVVIMITAYEDAGSVISSMKLGAYDYVIKPIQMDG
ncbi:MAG: response regulator, partial [Desulfosarcina sp.]|nr:response regulator [Desulfobacterales bacterium]